MWVVHATRRWKALLLLATLAAAPPTTPAPSTQPTQEDQTARLTIQVRVNGHGPYPFLIDTGADRSVISQELAQTLNLPPGRTIALHDVAGAHDVQSVLIDTLSFGNREIHAIRAPAVAARGLGSAGLLGLDCLQNQVVIMDFDRKTFSVVPAQTEPIRPDAIIVEGRRRRFGQLVLIDANSQTVPVFVVLDSGAQTTIGNPALRRLIAEDSRQTGDPIPDKIIGVTGATTQGEIDQMPTVQLGGITINHIPIVYADLHTFTHFGIGERPAMLLGMDVLHHFRRVEVDFQSREVRFTIR